MNKSSDMLTTEDALRLPGDGVLCAGLYLIKDGKVLQGFRMYEGDVASWIPPGGRSEIDETLEETLRREVLEEVGIKDIRNIQFCGSATGTNPKACDVFMAFTAETSEEFELREPDKFREWRWIPLDEYFSNSEFWHNNPPAKECVRGFLN